ncbi:hypothetical protein J7T55_009736 [Diaporthe amygdali]|uniref:uncharacterized protein n=1 Tax=Phomopsis amygdali TaxID=1214568 RepID=UPI0022FF2845|nr:uncharacterized protein J7T55_009736 [Diaporthe amygdali]KAJ0116586.1 hypothetical protein J7T55_009736 [Diaporthe amygdali]
MARLKVLICGGGVAGNALAFWLNKLDHDVTIVEWYPDLRVTGLQIDLRGYGIEVLKRMGLDDEFRAHAAKEEGLKVMSSSGKQWAYFPANKSGKGKQTFTSDYEIMRGDLTRIFHNASKAKILFGTSVKSFEEKGDSVEVVFSDGKADRFDLLVGADGQWSRTRNMMIERDTPDPMHFLRHNVYIGYYTMPKEIEPGETYDATIFPATRGRLIIMRRSNPHQIQVYLQLMYTAATERLRQAHRGGVDGEKAAMAEIFQGAGWRTEEFLKGLEKSDDFYLERLGVVKLDSWSRGHVTLVGDAAHCPSAVTGMGTTSAIVGTYILAGEIDKHCGRLGTNDGLAVALKEYDQKHRPFVNHVQEGVVEGSRFYDIFPTSWWGIAVLNFLLWVITVLRLDVIGQWAFREADESQWQLPEYEEMLSKVK